MNLKKWTIKRLLEVTTDFLKNKNIDNPRLSADLLLAHQLKVSRIKLYLDFDQPLSEKDLSGYRELVKRRINREPIQYIIGIQEFWSMEFKVSPQVLIPRPESEILVEQVASLIKNKKIPHCEQPKILDLGTGSGALAVSFAKEFENALIWASDISRDALEIARLNAQKNHVDKNISFVQGDLWAPFKDKLLPFDIIVSNPPYIASEDFQTLEPEVRDHEPRLALDGFQGGMHYITRIISDAENHLSPEGWLLLEMAPSQISKAQAHLENINGFVEVNRIEDYNHSDRVLMAKKKSAVT
ncbi:MAG: peptide chain release factor N(5)-glutamine methyltransferase [Deltaproteobacteria bacterium]|nr:peptide chain release factor N(5)-glutamine methyltransferase [Deltaproteobacteria bacterium]